VFTTLIGDVYDINKERAKADKTSEFNITVMILDAYGDLLKGFGSFEELPNPKINFLRIPPLYYPIYQKNPSDLLEITKFYKKEYEG